MLVSGRVKLRSLLTSRRSFDVFSSKDFFVGDLQPLRESHLIFVSVKQLAFSSFPANLLRVDLGDSKNRGTPKWMVYNGKSC